MEWTYIKNPAQHWLGTDARRNMGDQRSPGGTPNVESQKPFTHEQHVPMS
jgi:Mn-containing catalase